jgi:photosystem II stability/assembly factor-like uncharacterized protein
MIKSKNSLVCSLSVLAFLLVLVASASYAEYHLNDVTYGKNLFVAVGCYGPPDTGSCGRTAILTSPDGINWIERKNPNGGDVKFLIGVVYVNNLFVAVGYHAAIFTSPDGINWTAAVVSEEYSYSYIGGVTYGKNIFVGVGFESFEGVFVTSLDGQYWILKEYDNSDSYDFYLYDIAYGKNIFAVVGEKSDDIGDIGVLLTSPDGMTWRETSINYICRGITYGKNMFLAVGEDGVISTSPDGLNWSQRNSGTTNNLYDAIYGKKLFVAVGDSGTIVTSKDGKKWTVRNPGTTDNYLHGVAYGNNLFVAVGENNTILTSPDGKTWTEKSIY